MAYASPITPVASAARTASGNSGSLTVTNDAGGTVALFVDVTAVTGTSPTLDLTIKWSHDGTTFGDADGTADTFAQVTAATTTVKRFDVKAPFYRVDWTIGGTTPSFTFSVSQYVTA